VSPRWHVSVTVPPDGRIPCSSNHPTPKATQKPERCQKKKGHVKQSKKTQGTTYHQPCLVLGPFKFPANRGGSPLFVRVFHRFANLPPCAVLLEAGGKKIVLNIVFCMCWLSRSNLGRARAASSVTRAPAKFACLENDRFPSPRL
jgi:hypothetical protein